MEQLEGWKADFMNRAGRRVQVQIVLTGMLIYLAMAIDLPQWALRAIDRIRKGFLWRGTKDVGGGGGGIVWGRVCRPFQSQRAWLGSQDGYGCQKQSLESLGLPSAPPVANS